MSRHLVIRDSYVINVVEWDSAAQPDWVYPLEHDLVIEDPHGNSGIGDWYEAEEGILYRPLSNPPDLPEELQ
jgi:hypothetical protein